MRTLAVDPGLDGLGVALFEGLELVQAWYSPGPARLRTNSVRRDGDGTLERGPRVWRGVALSIAWLGDDPRTRPDRLVVEQTKVYAGRGGFDKDPADLLELSGVVGAVAMVFPGVEVGGVLARDWKGQVPKPIMLERIRGWLGRRAWLDRVVVPEKRALVHNAIDAAGLGMVALRLEGKLSKDPF
jgi:hypothetical protein